MISEWIFGTLPDVRKVTAYRLVAPSGMEAVILNYGLILQSLILPNGRCVTLGYDRLDEYVSGEDYRGAIIGPNANRIVGARYEIDGQEFELPANDGKHNLHSGPDGFDRQIWDVRAESDRLEARYVSKPGPGFQGTLRTEIGIKLENDGLRIKMKAQTDSAMPANLTWHPYWNLASEGRIDGHDLQVESSQRTVLETGRAEDVSMTRFDFRKPLPLGHIQLDDNYRQADRVRIRHGGLQLEVSSSLPDMQIYTGDALSVPRSGIAIEPQFQPNDINFEKSCLLRPGETYDHWIAYQFTGLD